MAPKLTFVRALQAAPAASGRPLARREQSTGLFTSGLGPPRGLASFGTARQEAF
jgi:hypothetical protein